MFLAVIKSLCRINFIHKTSIIVIVVLFHVYLFFSFFFFSFLSFVYLHFLFSHLFFSFSFFPFFLFSFFFFFFPFLRNFKTFRIWRSGFYVALPLCYCESAPLSVISLYLFPYLFFTKYPTRKTC